MLISDRNLMRDLVVLAIVALVAVIALVVTSGVTGAPLYSEPCKEAGVNGFIVDGIALPFAEVQGYHCFTTPGFGDQYCCMRR